MFKKKLIQAKRKVDFFLLILALISIFFIVNFRFSSLHPHKEMLEMEKIQKLFNHYLEKDLCSNERDLFRNSNTFFLPYAIQEHHSLTALDSFFLELSPFRRNVLKKRKIIFTTYSAENMPQIDLICKALDMMSYPSYEKGWDQFRHCTETIASHIRKSIRDHGYHPEDYFMVSSDRLESRKDYLILDSVSIETLGSCTLKKSWDRSLWNYKAVVTISNDTDIRIPSLYLDVEIVYCRWSNDSAIFIKSYDLSRQLLGKLDLYHMEVFLNNTEFEYQIALP